jgi:hypothetical protein
MPATRGRSKTPAKSPSRGRSKTPTPKAKASPKTKSTPKRTTPVKKSKSPAPARRRTAVNVRELNPTPGRPSSRPAPKTAKPKKSSHPLLLVGSSSVFGSTAPPALNTVVTMAFWNAAFFFVEYTLREVFARTIVAYPVFALERSRHVLARHIGTDFFACALCAGIACLNLKHLDSFTRKFWDPDSRWAKAYESRMYKYIPEAHHVLLIFSAYQIKNLFDAVVWNDGPLFIFHHVFSFIASWSAMHGGGHGLGHTYALFYMGVSEISTTVRASERLNTREPESLERASEREVEH